MPFKFIIQLLRYLLFPVSVIYGIIVVVRNYLFDKKIFRSATFTLPVICVGNLSVGGTGKTPMTEYLIRLLKTQFRVATLSRGYKRKTKGYLLADANTTAENIGDEPMQFHVAFPEIQVAVGEERVEAIPSLLYDAPDTDAIILDDAFQHRAVKAGLNILLTEYGNLYTRDFFIPTGNLRDARVSAKRADIIVVTKCEQKISLTEKEKIISEIRPLLHQHVFFTTVLYRTPYHLFSMEEKKISGEADVLLITGIANAGKLIEHLKQNYKSVDTLKFNDHHNFSKEDIASLKNRFLSGASKNKVILTTAKDATKLVKFKNQLSGLPVYVFPMEHFFLFGEQQKFDELVLNFTMNFSFESV